MKVDQKPGASVADWSQSCETANSTPKIVGWPRADGGWTEPRTCARCKLRGRAYFVAEKITNYNAEYYISYLLYIKLAAK